MSASSKPLLTVRGLKVTFPIYGGVLRHKIAEVRAVDGVSFEIRERETLGLVGESGSGKTTIGRALLNLLRYLSPEVQVEGEVLLHHDGRAIDLNGLSRRALKPLRPEMQMIFQDPYSSLNPRMTVREIIERPLRLHAGGGRGEREKRVFEILERVGLQPDAAVRFPHEFSGGQRQRIGIARALVTRPRLIIADEPVSALDVSVRAQVVNLMMELQKDFGLACLFIAHDLSVVHHVSDRIAVLYLGTVVEIGTAIQIYNEPRHPYTRALLAAVPSADPKSPRLRGFPLRGEIPSPLKKPSGCVFHPRCPIAQPACSKEAPALVEIEAGRQVACPYALEFEKLSARRD
ncbi:MAG: ATP-binding cassette domain-containing protein [Planctomycetes bacterium]|nr:ATP-binding cassette domain-containing protein [Planctomycetota bacterium]